jgi:hypothetical protein
MHTDSEPGGNVTVERQHSRRRRLPGSHFGPSIAAGSPFAPTAHLSGRMERMMDSFDRQYCNNCADNCTAAPSASDAAALPEELYQPEAFPDK